MKAMSKPVTRVREDFLDKENTHFDEEGAATLNPPPTHSFMEPGKVGERKASEKEA